MVAKLIAVGVILSLLGWGAYAALNAAYQSGVNAERVRQSDALAAEEAAEKETVKEIIQWRTKERIVYRDRIQTIHTAADPTGCLDTDLRDVGLGFMLSAPGSH